MPTQAGAGFDRDGHRLRVGRLDLVALGDTLELLGVGDSHRDGKAAPSA